MSVRIVPKGDKGKGNESVQRKVFHHNTAQKPFVFHDVPKPSPQLSDKSEFPSLNEISGKTSNNSHSTGRMLKYSDKLKSHTTGQNQDSIPKFFHYKNDPVLTDPYKEFDDSTSNTQLTNKWFNNENKTNLIGKKTFQSNFQNEPDKSIFVNAKKVDINSTQNIPKVQSIQSHSSKHSDHKNQSPKVKHLVNTSNSKLHASHKTSALTSNYASLSSTSNNQAQSNNEVRLILENSAVKEGDDTLSNNKSKKKKKRKSKIKRQVTLQTGKITVLTPEVHSKIVNQKSALTVQNPIGVLTDINDEEEYPELGKSLVPASLKENFLKKENIAIESTHEAKELDKSIATSAEKQLFTKDITKELAPCISNQKPIAEKKVKSDNKAVHPNDPITVSFYDMILNKSSKTKVKDFKVEVDTPTTTGLVKIKSKMNACHPHNLLDSSSPAIKRGKEREKPKPKKPSQLKKIILLDRKVRREQLLQSKNYNLGEENAAIGNESVQEINTCEDDNEVDKETNILSENNTENSPSNILTVQLEVSDQNTVLLPSDDDNLNLLHDELVPEMGLMNVSDINENWNVEETVNNLSTVAVPIEDIEANHFTEEAPITLSLDKISVNNRHAESETSTDPAVTTEMHLNVSKSPDLLLNALTNNIKKLEINDKEKAVKILLHTRNFREYCNHLISKDIDDVVFALLDDLARFQDRLHQKDPIKARMKRRMIYGVKEVKKHIKLKKLKCIIVAADIENIEAHGGLNDLLNDIKSSAADHHIPCVFALSRKVLGKVCRKPVPVSCVGVFNFEGSEANFKKMVQLQTQSKIDYAEIFDKLSLRLTEEQVANLLKTKKEAPESLRAIRTSILGDFFLEPNTETIESNTLNLKCEKSSDLSDTEA